MNFTIAFHISLNPTNCHHISLNHTKSHHISLIFTKSQLISPKLNVKVGLHVGKYYGGDMVFFEKNPLYFHYVGHFIQLSSTLGLYELETCIIMHVKSMDSMSIWLYVTSLSMTLYACLLSTTLHLFSLNSMKTDQPSCLHYSSMLLYSSVRKKHIWWLVDRCTESP